MAKSSQVNLDCCHLKLSLNLQLIVFMFEFEHICSHLQLQSKNNGKNGFILGLQLRPDLLQKQSTHRVPLLQARQNIAIPIKTINQNLCQKGLT